MTDEVRERRFAPFVRLEVEGSMPSGIVLRLAEEMKLQHQVRGDGDSTCERLCDFLCRGRPLRCCAAYADVRPDWPETSAVQPMLTGGVSYATATLSHLLRRA